MRSSRIAIAKVAETWGCFIIMITMLRERIHHLSKGRQRDRTRVMNHWRSKCKLSCSMRRGGRARFKAHAWNACKLERVSGVRIPPSPPASPRCRRYLGRSWELSRGSGDNSGSKGTRDSVWGLVRPPTSLFSLRSEKARSPLPHLHSILLDGVRRMESDRWLANG